MEPLWDETRNGVPFSSSLKHSVRFWWKGECGHSWEATIYNKKQYGCTVCAGKVIVAGVNDLASHYPELAKQWHPTKNSLKSSEVAKKTPRKFWWSCEKGHEWEAKVLSRANGAGCPVCANFVLLAGFNDFGTLYPEIATEWHPEKNKDLLPSQVNPSSSTIVWWLGKNCGHSWESPVGGRTGKGTGCKECSGKNKSLQNSNAKLDFPHLYEQWSARNSKELSDYVSNSREKVWWVCGKVGHEWSQSVRSRVRAVGKCPICSGHILVPGVNDLATLNPVLAAEWHSEKNGGLTPEQVTGSSGKKAWWLSKDCGHEWEAQIYNRANGSGCFPCKYEKGSKTKRTPTIGVTDLASQTPEVAKEWHPTKNGNLHPDQVNSGSKLKVWWVCEKGHEWETKIMYRTNKGGTGCPICSANNFSSKAERSIYEYVSGLVPSAVANTRKVIYPYELDVFVEEKRLAVEYNGVYWHSEKRKAESYHYDKWLACKNKGIQLVQVWEDDWNRNPELVKKLLDYKFGFEPQEAGFEGSSGLVKEVSSSSMRGFLELNHIQGFVDSDIRLGLFEAEGLVAVMALNRVLSEGKQILEILRYSASSQVSSGFVKLLNYVERVYVPEGIVVFSDNSFDTGELYANNGFVAVSIVPPDYMWVGKDNQRVDKSVYSLERFREDPELKYVDGLAVFELVELNGVVRVWDAGKTRWISGF